MSVRRVLLWLVPLLLLTFWLGARRLDSDTIWLDEYFSIYDAGGGAYGPLSPPEIWNRVATRNPWHAPGYFILLSGWGRLAGWEPAALRAFSLLLGVVAVAGAYRLGTVVASRRVGMYAAIILGTSAFFVYYTHEIRMYTLIALLCEAAIWLYLRLAWSKHEPTKGQWAAFPLVLTGALYTHYLTVFPLIGIALYHLLFAYKDLSISRNFSPSLTEWRGGWGVRLLNRRWWLLTGSALAAGVLYLPWLSAFIAGLGLATGAEELHDRTLTTRRLIEMLLYLFGNGLWLMPLVFGALALPSLRRRRPRAVWVITGVALLAIIVFNEALQIIPITRLRYLLSLWSLLAILMALGIHALRRYQPLPVLALAAWFVLGLYSAGNTEFVSHLASAGYTYPLHRIDDVLRARGQAGDFVVNILSPGMAAVTYDRTGDFYFSRRRIAFDNVEPKGTADAQAAEYAAARDSLQDSSRVWLTYETETPDVAAFRDALEETYNPCTPAVEDTALHMTLYIRNGASCPS